MKNKPSYKRVKLEWKPADLPAAAKKVVNILRGEIASTYHDSILLEMINKEAFADDMTIGELKQRLVYMIG